MRASASGAEPACPFAAVRLRAVRRLHAVRGRRPPLRIRQHVLAYLTQGVLDF